MSTALDRFVERHEETFLPRRRFPRSDHVAWLRAALLMWSGLGMTTVLTVVALAAAVAGRGHVAWSASLAALSALILVARHRVAPAPRLHGHMMLTLLLCTAGLTDLAAGGWGLGAAALLPLVLLIAVVALPQGDAGLWAVVAACGTLLAAFFAPAVMGHAGYAFAFAAGVALAMVVGARVVVACEAIVRAARDAGTDAAVAHEHERHDRERFDAFVALPGDWYFETEVDLSLSFLSPGFVARFGVVEDAVLGHTPEDVIRAAFPDAQGTEELARVMRQRLEFSAQILGWTGADGRRVALRVNGWPAHAGNGLFLGYRGAAREVPASLPDPATASATTPVASAV